MKAWMVRLALVCVSLGATLVALEFVTRAMEQIPRKTVHSDRPKLDRVQKRLNKFRDVVHTTEKSSDVFRILVLGDSFTYAGKVYYEDGYAARLERILNSDNTFGKRVEVIKLAYPGYATLDELTALEKIGLRYSPDLVLLQIFLNDPDYPPRTKFYRDRMRKWAHFRALPIFDRWHLGKFVADRVYNTMSHKELVNYYFHLFSDKDHWHYFTSHMERIKRVCRNNKIAFASFLFPTFSFPLDEGEYPFTEIHEKIARFSAKHRMPFLDLRPYYRDMLHTRLQAEFQADGHPNEIAHRIAAEALADWLPDQHFSSFESLSQLPIASAINLKRIASEV